MYAAARTRYRFVVIDSEAGMEHISRVHDGKPDMLLIVSDPGAGDADRREDPGDCNPGSVWLLKKYSLS